METVKEKVRKKESRKGRKWREIWDKEESEEFRRKLDRVELGVKN